MFRVTSTMIKYRLWMLLFTLILLQLLLLLNIPEYASINRVLDMPDIVHNLTSLYKVGYLAFIETEECSEPWQTANMECCGRIIISFN